jgi:peptide/nickel transport system permease protein
VTVYAVRRLLLGLLSLVGVAVVVFVIVRLLPGDVVTQLVGLEANVTAEQRAELRRLFGLDAPLHIQFTDWAGLLATGNLGSSLRTGRPVLTDLLLRFPVTLQLTLLSLIVTIGIAVPLGTLAAVQRGRAGDLIASLLALIGLAAPNFWLAILFILLFSLQLRIFPPGGYVPFSEDPLRNLHLMVMPAVTLGLALAAATTRIVRSTLLEVLGRDYVRTARAKGLGERVVVYKHAMRNALIPVVTVIGLQMGNLLGGAVIIEQVFALPGVGRFALEGINLRDYPVVQGAVLLIASTYVLVNLFVDLLYGWIDPRIRYD